jgi:hypothetical protein
MPWRPPGTPRGCSGSLSWGPLETGATPARSNRPVTGSEVCTVDSGKEERHRDEPGWMIHDRVGGAVSALVDGGDRVEAMRCGCYRALNQVAPLLRRGWCNADGSEWWHGAARAQWTVARLVWLPRHGSWGGVCRNPLRRLDGVEDHIVPATRPERVGRAKAPSGERQQRRQSQRSRTPIAGQHEASANTDPHPRRGMFPLRYFSRLGSASQNQAVRGNLHATKWKGMIQRGCHAASLPKSGPARRRWINP